MEKITYNPETNPGTVNVEILGSLAISNSDINPEPYIGHADYFFVECADVPFGD